MPSRLPERNRQINTRMPAVPARAPIPASTPATQGAVPFKQSVSIRNHALRRTCIAWYRPPRARISMLSTPTAAYASVNMGKHTIIAARVIRQRSASRSWCLSGTMRGLPQARWFPSDNTGRMPCRSHWKKPGASFRNVPKQTAQQSNVLHPGAIKTAPGSASRRAGRAP